MAITPLNSFDTDGVIDESSAVFGAFPAPDEPLFLSALPLFSPPPIDGGIDISQEFFSSTPLPLVQPGEQTETQPQIQTQRTRIEPKNESTTPGRDVRLRDVPVRPAREPTPSSSPEPRGSRRKRKSLTEGDDDYGSPESMSDDRQNPMKKTAHNMIEKRYRTNLNDKIAALRDAVPSLRVTNKNSHGEEVLQEDLQGLTPAHKLNKATVLSKATEYIAHLERRNKTLSQENSALKARIDAFEIMVLARQGQNAKQTAALKLQSRMW